MFVTTSPTTTSAGLSTIPLKRAFAQLRHGNVTEAVAWYTSSRRSPRRLPCQATRNATSCMTQLLAFWVAVPA